ncbi:hypothetical protein QF023_001486 [Chryseobacterium sp. SLBN-27]|nr:hypothetical protein [Chryseobacterium sp. SLBN-27]
MLLIFCEFSYNKILRIYERYYENNVSSSNIIKKWNENEKRSGLKILKTS